MSILCADIGTSSLKTALIDLEGCVLAQHRVSFPKAEFNQSAICSTEFGDNPCCQQGLFSGNYWTKALAEASHELLCKASFQQDHKIEGICVSGNGPTLATERGEIFLWNHPAPSGMMEEIQQTLASNKLFSIFLPRLLLFKKLFPSEWGNTPTIFSGPEYLIWCLTGEKLTVLPEKKFQLAYWNKEALEKLGIEEEKLPDFVRPGTRAGNLLPAMASLLGLPEETPVFCGGPDFTVALIGTNTLEPGKLCDRAGSSEGINLCLDKNPSEAIQKAGIEGIRVLPSVIEGLFNASVLIPDSGTRFSKFKKAVAPHMSYQEFVAALLENPALSLEGFNLMKELALEVKIAYEKLSAIAKLTGICPSTTIATTGGQAKNQKWLQFKSQIIGAIFSITACADAELVGNAVLAYYGLGKFSSIKEGAKAIVQIYPVDLSTDESV